MHKIYIRGFTTYAIYLSTSIRASLYYRITPYGSKVTLLDLGKITWYQSTRNSTEFGPGGMILGTNRKQYGLVSPFPECSLIMIAQHDVIASEKMLACIDFCWLSIYFDIMFLAWITFLILGKETTWFSHIRFI